MGTLRHELVVFEVIGYQAQAIQAAVSALREEMPEKFARLVVGPIQAPMNGSIWYAMFPDGSKEWWDTSDEANDWRAKFKALAPYTPAHFAWGDNGPEADVTESWDSRNAKTAGQPEG